jgi:hypothetical protein
VVDRRGFQKQTKNGKTETTRRKKRSRTSTERRIQKECQGKRKWQYPDSDPGIPGPPTAPRWKRLAINYAPSATTIYPSTTYCGNAKKDQRMKMDMIKEKWINGKKCMEKIIDYAKEIRLYNGI